MGMLQVSPVPGCPPLDTSPGRRRCRCPVLFSRLARRWGPVPKSTVGRCLLPQFQLNQSSWLHSGNSAQGGTPHYARLAGTLQNAGSPCLLQAVDQDGPDPHQREHLATALALGCPRVEADGLVPRSRRSGSDPGSGSGGARPSPFSHPLSP